MSTIVVHRRNPRFRRAAQRPAFQLTDDDIAIVRHVARHRFLRSTHITALIGRSHEKVCKRLAPLYHAGFLDRPPAQLDYYRPGGGSQRMVYALGNRGAQLLIERDGLEDARVDWTRKNKDAKRQFILHTLAIADLRVALDVAMRTRTNVLLEGPDQLIARMPASTRNLPQPLGLRVKVQHNGPVTQIGVVPDHAFAVTATDGSRHCYLVECDRGTMPVARASLHQTSILKKLLAYETARMQGVSERQWGWRAFRVLIITNSAQRAGRIRETIVGHPKLAASPLFLIADQAALDSRDILTFPWPTARGTIHVMA